MSYVDTDRRRVEQVLAGLPEPVKLVFFTQTFGCDGCLPARRIISELAALSDRVSIEEHNLILDKDEAQRYAVERAPATVFVAGGAPRLRFYGVPSGYELASFVELIRLASTGEAGLRPETEVQLAALDRAVHLQVFVTPTCVYCPQMVVLAARLAIASPMITASIVEATEFPDLVQRYRITGVPKTIVDEQVEIVGVQAEDAFVEQILHLPDGSG